VSRIVWRKWNPKAVKDAAIEEIAGSMEIVGKFVETEARRRLLSIADPDWGAAYRRGIVSRLLTYQVSREANAVVCTVGVAVGSKGRHHGFWIETGSATAPAHPFLRPAVFNNGAKIVALLGGQ